MKREAVVLLVILLLLVSIGTYFLITKKGNTTANAIQQSEPEQSSSDYCTSDSEPQCINHKIGATCTNIRDGGISGVCIERYQACVCR